MEPVSVILVLLLVSNTVFMKPAPSRKEKLFWTCVEIPCSKLENCHKSCATLCILKPVDNRCKFKDNANPSQSRCIRYDDKCNGSTSLIPCRTKDRLECDLTPSSLGWKRLK